VKAFTLEPQRQAAICLRAVLEDSPLRQYRNLSEHAHRGDLRGMQHLSCHMGRQVVEPVNEHQWQAVRALLQVARGAKDDAPASAVQLDHREDGPANVHHVELDPRAAPAREA